MRIEYVVEVSSPDDLKRQVLAELDRRYSDLSISYSRLTKQREQASMGARMLQLREIREFLANLKIEVKIDEPPAAQQG